MNNVDDLTLKYKQRLERELGETAEQAHVKAPETREYLEFKKELMPRRLTYYEKGCKFAENLLKMKPDPKKAALLQESIDIAHLDITPAGSMSFSIVAPIFIAVVGSLLSFLILNSMFYVVLFLISGVVMIKPLANIPNFIANSWRMKASNQMVLCVFYVVTYMRHTSNIELGIEFASLHLSPPLSLDLKKVLWNVETGKYESVKESLDVYLEGWKKWNMEFVEAFHLIESSLFESSDERRLSLLDKSLDVILDETYEKMLHYAQSLKSPITMLHMMGVILPILGLVILPLMVSFMEGVEWFHIAAIYNIILPISIFFMGKNILANRPTGYGDTDIGAAMPKKKSKFLGIDISFSPRAVAWMVGITLLLIGLSPVILGSLLDTETLLAEQPFIGQYKFLGYKEAQAVPGKIIGPFGDVASVLSLFIPLSLALGLGIYYRMKSQNVLEMRNKAKQLEKEFASALFQLGNRLGDGMPAEMAFGRVAEVMQGTTSGNFFQLVNINISKLGMSVEQAVFDEEHGALRTFPSSIIDSSMKVLVQSMKKGPMIAAQALLNVSRYIKEIHRVDERLKDLMAEIISSMKSQVKFMSPAISGIVIGITSMITNIIGKLGGQIQQIGSQAGAQATGLSSMFGDGIPTYFFQAVVGVYVVQLVYILTVLTNGIENGEDKLNERYTLGQNLVRSTMMYIIISLVVMVIFNLIANQIVGATLPGA